VQIATGIRLKALCPPLVNTANTYFVPRNARLIHYSEWRTVPGQLANGVTRFETIHILAHSFFFLFRDFYRRIESYLRSIHAARSLRSEFVKFKKAETTRVDDASRLGYRCPQLRLSSFEVTIALRCKALRNALRRRCRQKKQLVERLYVIAAPFQVRRGSNIFRMTPAPSRPRASIENANNCSSSEFHPTPAFLHGNRFFSSVRISRTRLISRKSIVCTRNKSIGAAGKEKLAPER
jgi:hypothetical protein